MEKLLKEISKRALLLNDFEFSEEQIKTKWLGSHPAIEEEIKAVEKRLNISLPNDYIEFLKLSNGFPIITNIGCALLTTDKIDYLKVLNEYLVDTWNEHESLKDIGEALARSILIGGFQEEQQILLIPPKSINDKWQCWRFRKYISKEDMFKSFDNYLKNELKFLKSLTKRLRKPNPRIVIDYSLRDAVFALDWQNVFEIAMRFAKDEKYYGYYNGIYDLYPLMLLASYKTNRQEEFLQFIEKIKGNELLSNNQFLTNYEQAANDKLSFLPKLKEFHRFVPQTNPRGLDEIEELIERSRKELLKPKNWLSKVDYQLGFLFDFGNINEFLKLYETYNNEQLFITSHIHAATIYAYLNDIIKAKEALKKYQDIMFDLRPFKPFLNEALLQVLEYKNL